MLYKRPLQDTNTVKVPFCWLLFLFLSLNCWHMPQPVSIYSNVKYSWFCSHFVFVDKNAMSQHVNKKELWLYHDLILTSYWEKKFFYFSKNNFPAKRYGIWPWPNGQSLRPRFFARIYRGRVHLIWGSLIYAYPPASFANLKRIWNGKLWSDFPGNFQWIHLSIIIN